MEMQLRAKLHELETAKAAEAEAREFYRSHDWEDLPFTGARAYADAALKVADLADEYEGLCVEWQRQEIEKMAAVSG